MAVLAHAPEELTRAPLQRLGEGVGKVVYASEHWVVKRERSHSEVVALIAIWKVLRRLAHYIPAAERYLQHPSRLIRFLRVMLQSVVRVVPRAVWFLTHAGQMSKTYLHRDVRGAHLAETYLHATAIVPARIEFPPTRVQVGGWPGWLTVCEATERMEMTLLQKIERLAAQGNYDEVEAWLNRFVDLRQSGWQRGLFSIDAHLKNFGVTGDRVVLLDTGGLTETWSEIEARLNYESGVMHPHIELGLQQSLNSRPDIADRFNRRWKATVNIDGVRGLWPAA